MDIPPPGTVMYLASVIYILAAAGIYGCISAQVQYYLPPEMAEKHWGITGKSQRVFSVPGVWVTVDVFQQRYSDTFQLVGPIGHIGRDKVFMFTRKDAP